MAQELNMAAEVTGPDVEFDLDSGEMVETPAADQPGDDTGGDSPAGEPGDLHDDDEDIHHDEDVSTVDSDGQQLSDEDVEAKRARRRQERQNRKNAQRERFQSMERDISMLREQNTALLHRLGTIERSTTGAELAALDKSIGDVTNAYNYWKDQVAVHTTAGNGEGVAEATEKMLLAQRRYEELNRIKTAHAQRATAPAPIDPAIKNEASKWMSKHKWYDPACKDTDSQIAFVLSKGLDARGLDSRTQAYWDALDAEVKKYLPHRANPGYNSGSDEREGRTVDGQGQQQQQRRQPPKSPTGGSGQGDGGNRKTFVLSAARVQAMKDAGVYDDPVKRKEQIRRYQEYDRQNATK